jgi:hypothetical protein
MDVKRDSSSDLSVYPRLFSSGTLLVGARRLHDTPVVWQSSKTLYIVYNRE